MLQAPFPWFGGKSKVTDIVWNAFGDIRNYVEPFFGSGAVMLRRPEGFQGPETVNDADGFLSNFWRAVKADPEAVAHFADWPVSECDLHARHAWILAQRGELTAKLEGDPEFYDVKIAGWWVWGICSWVGSGWCSGKGPWHVVEGKLIKIRQLPHLGNAGRGIKRQLPHLGNAGRGINRQLPHLGNAGRGMRRYEKILSTFQDLSDRFRHVRICCGDWSRVMGESVTLHHAGVTGVFLDPPYSDAAGRYADVYACDSGSIAHAVREWCLANGDNPRLRIALCGYEGEHTMPETWECIPWKTSGGYGSQSNNTGRDNAHRERIWLSPSCLPFEV